MACAQIRSPIAALRSTISGIVVLPGDADYELARLVGNLKADQYPALILFPATADDVDAGVAFASAQRLGVAILATDSVVFPGDDCLLIITAQNLLCFGDIPTTGNL